MKEDLIEQYINYLVLSGKSERTIELYVPIVESYLIFSNGNPLAVSDKDLIKFILYKEGTRSREQCIGALKHLFTGVLHSPKKMKFVPKPKREQYIPNILTQCEAEKLMKNIGNLKHQAVINLQYYGALRTGEITNLQILDIKKDATIHIRQSKGAKDRLIPIPDHLLFLLRKYYKVYKPEMFLFNGQNSPIYSDRSIQKIVKKYCKANGVYRKIRPHDLRHSRATHLHENGMGIKFIRDLLGHKSIKTTEVYLHSSTVNLREAINKAS